MNINFEYYKVFYIIAKNRNITKAANELNITQPSISRMLKTMEEQMNTKLFIRKTKGVILTQEGQELYRLIGDEIENIIKAENNFSKIINDEALKIATNKTYLNYLIDNNIIRIVDNLNI
jgi:DNA-binding transcriptional LysR family regulator